MDLMMYYVLIASWSGSTTCSLN